MTYVSPDDRRGGDGSRSSRGRPPRRRWVVITAIAAAGLVALPLVAALLLAAVDAVGLLPVVVGVVGGGYAIWRWGRRSA